MSYPLSQDVGYDPSVYTSEESGRFELVRDVIAYGHRILHVGLIRPLACHVQPGSVVQLDYEVTPGGSPGPLRLVLAARDGRRYEASLPSAAGEHKTRISGADLRVPAGGADIAAILLETDIANPILGSHNRLAIFDISVQAERPLAVRVSFPSLVADPATGDMVASSDAGEGSDLRLRLGPTASPVRVALYDGAGHLEETQMLERGERNATLSLATNGRPPAPGLWTAKLTDSNARTTFRFLVLGDVPPHPRVLLSETRLSELRRQSNSNPLLRIIELRAPQLAATLAYNASAGDNIALLPSTSVHTASQPYFRLMESYSNSIVFNALVFRLKRDPQALDAARRGLLTVCQWRTWTPPWFSGLRTYYEVGVFSQRVALAYDLLADQFSVTEKEEITRAFWRNSIQPTLEDYFLLDRLPIAASNHEANSVGGAIAALVSVYGDVPAWNGRLSTALAELIACDERMLGRGLFPGDGSEAEPAGYESFAMEGLSSALAALSALGIRPRGTERMMDAFWWPDYAMVKPDLVLDTGDFDGDLAALPGFAWGAENGGNPYLRAFYGRATDPRLAGLSRVENTGRLLEMAPGQLDLVCCTQPEASLPLPPPSRVFPLRGSAVLRSGWSPTDTVISLRAGPWFNHEHHDEGSFQVAAFGDRLISEAGYANYYADPYYPTYFTQAAGHNVVLIDGDPFSQTAYQGKFWAAFSDTPRITGHVLSPEIDYLAADLGPAYGGRLSSYTREYLFFKPDLLIISDRIAAPEAHRFTWLLHLPAGDEASLHGAEAVIHGEAGDAVVDALGSASEGPWALHPTPLPISDYAELDHARVLPEQELRLNSMGRNAASFLVSVRLVRHGAPRGSVSPFSTPAGEGLRGAFGGATFEAVFRSGNGTLRARNATADADALGVFATQAAEAIVARHLKSLRVDGSAWLSADVPIDAVIRRSAASSSADFSNAVVAAVRIRSPKTPGRVTLDGKQVALTIEDGLIVLRSVPPGDHRVEIAYK